MGMLDFSHYSVCIIGHFLSFIRYYSLSIALFVKLLIFRSPAYRL